MDQKHGIKLIEINKEDDKFKCSLTDESRAIFKSIEDKEIVVIAVAGPQRTGKSFLCNVLVNSMNGFQLGNSTLPQTKGIYMWSEPLIIDNKAVIIVDTEGLNSVLRDKQIDQYLLGITMLISSVFIYNNFGVINEKELSDIASSIELTKWVEQGANIPYFLWCLRDFSLDEVNQFQDSDEYLEKVLFTSQNLQENQIQIRKSIKEFFKKRGCLFFV